MDNSTIEIYLNGLLFELIRTQERPYVEYLMEEVGVMIYDLEHIEGYIDLKGFDLEDFCEVVLHAKDDRKRYVFMDSGTGLVGYYKDYDAMINDYISKLSFNKKKEITSALLNV